jgi:GT2 family glycosyltransferase
MTERIVPAVSIVLPTFNREAYLRETIAGVMAQTFTDWELVIADDGSDEPTRSYLRGIADRRRVRVLFMTHSGNPAAVRNAALRLAHGELVAFLDSDDVWEPAKLERQVAALAHTPGAQWCYGAFRRVDAQGAMLADESARGWSSRRGWIFGDIVAGEISLRTPCVMARRALVARLGGFDERLHDCEDLDLWLRLALSSEAAAVDEPLVRVRVAPGSYSSRERHARLDLLNVIVKLQPLAGARWQPLLRRERARHAMRLAREYAEAGESRQALAMLRSSLPFSWPYARSWYDLARALAGAWMGRA